MVNIITAQSIALECWILEKNRAQQEFEGIEGKKFGDLVGGLKNTKNEDDILKDKQRMKMMARRQIFISYRLDIQDAVKGDGRNEAHYLKKTNVDYYTNIILLILEQTLEII